MVDLLDCYKSILDPCHELVTSQGRALLLVRPGFRQLLAVDDGFPADICLVLSHRRRRPKISPRFYLPGNHIIHPWHIVRENLPGPFVHAPWCKQRACFNPAHRRGRPISINSPMDSTYTDEAEYEECRLLQKELLGSSLQNVKDHIYMEEFPEDLVTRVWQELNLKSK